MINIYIIYIYIYIYIHIALNVGLMLSFIVHNSPYGFHFRALRVYFLTWRVRLFWELPTNHEVDTCHDTCPKFRPQRSIYTPTKCLAKFFNSHQKKKENTWQILSLQPSKRLTELWGFTTWQRIRDIVLVQPSNWSSWSHHSARLVAWTLFWLVVTGTMEWIEWLSIQLGME